MSIKLVLLLTAAIGVVGVFTWFGGFKFFKTIVLIARVSPYERTIMNAPTILILGDSTGYGTGALKSEDTVAGRIAADFREYSIVNQSKNGRTVGELVEVARSVTGSYKLILLQIGGNDILQKRDSRTVESELRTIISELEDNTENLVMLSTGNVGGAPRFSKEKGDEYELITRSYREMFQRVDAETPLSYVDLFVEREEDLFIKHPDVYLAWDGLHPSSEGYKLWYEKLYPILKMKLEESL